MARIRSVHPGLFTDECFASLSMTARVLLIGIWTEADDAGVFEWKPVTLKMRIFPADNVDVPAALEEIEAAGAVKRFDAGGKVYGSVRNFCKYQRPKTPKSHHPLPDHIRKWTGVKDGEFPQNGETTSAEPEPFPQNGEIASQMEDGGGVGGGKEEKKKGARKSAPAYVVEGKVIKLAAKDFGTWRESYHAIPDLRAELQKADDYYFTNPPKGSWFHVASRWLAKAHNDALKAQPQRPDLPAQDPDVVPQGNISEEDIRRLIGHGWARLNEERQRLEWTPEGIKAGRPKHPPPLEELAA